VEPKYADAHVAQLPYSCCSSNRRCRSCRTSAFHRDRHREYSTRAENPFHSATMRCNARPGVCEWRQRDQAYQPSKALPWHSRRNPPERASGHVQQGFRSVEPVVQEDRSLSRSGSPHVGLLREIQPLWAGHSLAYVPFKCSKTDIQTFVNCALSRIAKQATACRAR